MIYPRRPSEGKMDAAISNGDEPKALNIELVFVDMKRYHEGYPYPGQFQYFSAGVDRAESADHLNKANHDFAGMLPTNLVPTNLVSDLGGFVPKLNVGQPNIHLPFGFTSQQAPPEAEKSK